VQIDRLNFAQIDVAPHPPTAKAFDRPPRASQSTNPAFGRIISTTNAWKQASPVATSDMRQITQTGPNQRRPGDQL